MILAINIGNTNMRAALGDEKGIVAQTVFYSHEGLMQIETNMGASIWDKIEGCIIATVVPSQTEIVLGMLQEKRKLVKRVDIRNCGKLKTERYTGLLGEDRVVCCASALQKYSPPFVVIDYGTATTINLVDANCEFLGGVILCGLRTGLNALTKNTAQLPSIDDLKTVPLIGTNTAENLISGAVIGLACATEGIIARMETEMGIKENGGILPAIVTGGHAPTILPHCHFEHKHEPSLLLEGLLSLWKDI